MKAILTIVALCLSLSAQAKVFKLSGRTMGTSYRIKMVGHPPMAIQHEIDSILIEINRKMSTYLKDSEISQFNRQSNLEPVKVSSDFLKVMALSREVFQISGGAFDPTLGKVVNLWGFGPEGRPNKVPEPEKLAQALQQIGYDKIVASADSIRKEASDLSLDFSAIAKGYGVDKVALFLESIGIMNYMVEIGGEVRTRGEKSKGQTWTIGIEMPITTGGAGFTPIRPGRMGLATSGDYRNYFEVDGRRMSHIIDPRTGKPVAHNLASVSVLDESCARADALATAFMVMGADPAMRLAKQHQIAAYFITREKDGFKKVASPEFEAYLVK